MTSDITMYELVGKADEPFPSFSPFVWKTKIDLAILKQPPAKQVPMSFVQINSDLRKISGNEDVTVPTIKVDGEFVTDSWVIAEYLEKKHGSTDNSLFAHGEVGKSFAKFIDIWSNSTLAGSMRLLILPRVYGILDGPSEEYFMESRFQNDKSKLDKMESDASDPSFISETCATVRLRLMLIEKFLETDDRPFLLGKEPSHADASVFGWYAFSRMNKDLVKGVWEHESLPKVGAWVERMSGMIKREELV